MTDALKSSMDMSRELFEKLSRHWHGLEEGVYRPGYSPEESEAIQIIIDEAKSMGMNAYEDLAGVRADEGRRHRLVERFHEVSEGAI